LTALHEFLVDMAIAIGTFRVLALPDFRYYFFCVFPADHFYDVLF